MPKPENFAKARDLFLNQVYPAKYKKMEKAGGLHEPGQSAGADTHVPPPT